MSDKMREEFEAWADLERWPLDHPMRHELMVAWQASRAALVVELPAEEEHKGIHYDIDYMPTDSVIAAIESTGVRTK